MRCPLYSVYFDKDDIKKDCKYCEKTNRSSLSSCAGYECKIKLRKRKMKRCCWCYFGHINFPH